MRLPRLTLAVTALTTALALTGCSGSDSDPGSDGASPSDGASSGTAAKPFERTCSVEVEVTGVAEASWQGKGRSSNEAGPTIYEFHHGDDQMLAYAGKDDIPTNANITIGGATYTTTDPQSGLEIADDGTKAEVDVDTTGVDGEGPHVSATFTCSKGGKNKG
jgi:hypothetical protein